MKLEYEILPGHFVKGIVDHTPASARSSVRVLSRRMGMRVRVEGDQ